MKNIIIKEVDRLYSQIHKDKQISEIFDIFDGR
jgi:hypothetical protein